MAEETKKKSTYKFGQKELDLDKYIYNLGTNLQRYLDTKTDWSDGQRQEFINSYNKYIQGFTEQRDNNTNRFYSDDMGNIYDSTGEFSDIDDDGNQGMDYYYDDKGNQISTADYDLLRRGKQKRYNKFSANQEVANYFNQVGRYMTPIEQMKKEKFELSKHGFLNHWNSQNNKTGGKTDLRPYLDMDQYNAETGKRARTNRMEYLSKQLNDYINGLTEDKYDWEGSGFKSMDDYKASLGELVKHMSDGVWDNNDMIAANQAGIDSSFYNAFFTEDENPNLTDAERTKLDQDKEQENRDNIWNNEKKRRYDLYLANRGSYHSNSPYRVQLKTYNNDDGTFSTTKWADSFEVNHPHYREMKDGNYENYMKKFYENPFTQEAGRALPFILNDNRFSRQLADGRYYIPYYNEDGTSQDEQTNTVLIFDPTNNTLKREFIGEVSDTWDDIKQQFSIAQGWTNAYDKYKKEGGVIKHLQFGGGVNVNSIIKERLDNETAEQAKKSGKSVSEYEADSRRVGLPGDRASDTAINDAEFTDVEYARIGSAIADIGAIGLSAAGVVTAGVGTVGSAIAGLGSTGLNLYADLRDEGVSGWQAVKNLGLNLGMDIVGLIPGGGAASKGAKILKSIGKIVPKVMLALSATSAFANRKEIMDSLQKATSNPKDMNVGDWQNLAQALSLVSGASQVAGTAYNKRAKNLQADFNRTQKVNDQIVVGVKDAQGNTRSVLFDGDDAKAIRAARDKGGKEGAQQINDILGKYENTQGWSVQQETKSGLVKGDKWYKRKWEDTGEGALSVRDLSADADGAYVDNGLFKRDQLVQQNGADVNLVTRKNGSVDTSETLTRLTNDDTIDAISKATKESEKNIAQSLKADFDALAASRTEATTKLEALRSKANSMKEQIGTDTWDNAKKELDVLTKRKASPEYTTRQNDLVTYRTKADANLKALQKVENDIALLEANPPVKKGKVNQNDGTYIPSKAEAVYEVQLKELKDKQAVLLNQVQADKNHIQKESDWLDIDDRISDIQSRQTELMGRDAELAKLNKKVEKARKTAESYEGKMPDSYTEFIRNNSDLDGNIFWDLPGGRKSKPITVEQFKEILKSHKIAFDKKGGSLNLVNLRKYNTGGVTHTKRTDVGNTDNGSGDKEGNRKGSTFGSAVGSILSNPTATIGLARAVYSDRVNRKMTDMAIDAEKPLIKDAFQKEVPHVVGNNSAVIQGNQNAANLNRMASKPLTSDAALHQATMLEAATKGEQFINQGKLLDNEAIQKSIELNRQIENENALARHTTAEENKASMMQTAKNKNAHEMAYQSTKHNIYDTYLQQVEYEVRQNQALQDSLLQQDVTDMLDYDLGNVASENGMTLSEESLAAWKKVRSGASQYTDLSEAEQEAYLQAEDASKQLSSLLIRKAKGLSVSPYFKLRNWKTDNTGSESSVPSWYREEVPGRKKGGSITKENARSEREDLKRFYNQIKETAKRHQKKLDQLADTVQGLIRKSK